MKKSRVAFFMLVCASMTSIAFAQQSSELLLPGGVLPPSSAAKIEPADRLASSLRLLSQNPYDVTALTLAGESALAVGDNNAALSFLARAEEINPASGRIKAGLGSALVQLERPREALRMFQEAVALGLPVHQLAKDRGLAFDLTGEPRRAQVDYGLALEHGGDDEVVRRMALSLGISGDKDAALRKIEPLIRRNDQAAWRARAMILAMNGDMRGGERIAEQVAPPGMASGLSQFMRRLAALGPADRAMAVTFGTMPQSIQGRPTSTLLAGTFRPIADRDAGLLAPVEVAPPVAAPVVLTAKQAKAQRRRPGRDEVQVAVAAPKQIVQPPAAVSPTLTPSAPKTNESTSLVGSDGRLKRVGQRLGPVDPARLPDELKPATAANAQVVRPTVLTTLPPPSGAVEVAKGPSVTPISSPVPEIVRASVEPEATTPIFEVPAPKVITPAVVAEPPKPVVVAAVVTPPPQPASIPAAAAPIVTTPVNVVPAASVQAELPATAVASPGFSAEVVAAALPAAQVVTAKLSTPSATLPEASPPPVAAPAAQIVAPAPAVVEPSAPAPAVGLGGLIANLELEAETSPSSVLTGEEFRKARLAAKKKAEADALKLSETTKLAEEKKKEEEERKRVAAANPARIWVQVATGSNEAGFGRTLSKLREQAPDALKGLGGATVPFRATNRILVGPFKSQAEAKATINKLAKSGVQATPFSSAAGEEVKRLPGK
jgi:Flp pilus assembly protein TadD